jgi:hypothetical protein
MVSNPEPVPGRPAMARLGNWLRKLGWLGFSVAIGGFVYGVVGRFTPTTATVVLIGLIAGSVLLLPGIIIGLGISAAERDERRPT